MLPRILLALLFCFSPLSRVFAQSLQTPSALPTQANVAPQSTKHITEYTLSPELLKKAKTLGTIRFVFRLFSFFFSLFALWLILRFKWSAKFRELAERASR